MATSGARSRGLTNIVDHGALHMLQLGLNHSRFIHVGVGAVALLRRPGISDSAAARDIDREP